MIPTGHVLAVAAALFSIGIFGLLIRRNILLMLLAIELMLNSANLTLVAGSALHGNVGGQIAAFFVMVVAAAEVAIGLAIVVLLFRQTESADTKTIERLKG